MPDLIILYMLVTYFMIVLNIPHTHTSTPIPPMYSTLPTNGNMTSHISSPDSQYFTLSNQNK